MTYDSPLWALEGEVANFKEEGLVTPEAGINLSMQGIEPLAPAWKARVAESACTIKTVSLQRGKIGSNSCDLGKLDNVTLTIRGE